MFKHNGMLDVSMFGRQVGKLALNKERLAFFEYNADWLANGFSISPFYLPLKPVVFSAKQSPFNGLFGVFNDSLPDGWGQLIIDRWLKSRGIDASSLSVLDHLSMIGDNGMGALSYRPEVALPEQVINETFGYIEIETQKILRNEQSDILSRFIQISGSSGGARPKILVQIDGKEWLIKFKAGIDPDDIGVIEYEYSLLAKKCGIDMPETRLFDGKYFGVRRFDRENGERIHMHSASGLLYASHRFPSLDYVELLKAAFILTRDMQEVLKLFRQMVFNVFIGNKDDHAKNFAFVVRKGAWKLSPAYDLLPSSGFNNQHSTTINGQGNPGMKDCLEVATKINIPPSTAKTIIDELNSIISQHKK